MCIGLLAKMAFTVNNLIELTVARFFIYKISMSWYIYLNSNIISIEPYFLSCFCFLNCFDEYESYSCLSYDFAMMIWNNLWHKGSTFSRQTCLILSLMIVRRVLLCKYCIQVLLFADILRDSSDIFFRFDHNEFAPGMASCRYTSLENTLKYVDLTIMV